MEVMQQGFQQTREYRLARKKARELKGFYIHLVVYCTVIPILIAVNLLFVPDYYWFPFSMVGWGIGVLFHWMEIRKITPFLGKGWEEGKVNELMEKEKARYEKFKQQ